MHRDIKPANVLFHNGMAKLADFGFCKVLNSPKDLSKSIVGSPLYMAAEVLLGKDYNANADIWSLGCVLYEMLFKHCPFETSNMSTLITYVETNEVEFPSTFSPLSENTKGLIRQMM